MYVHAYTHLMSSFSPALHYTALHCTTLHYTSTVAYDGPPFENLAEGLQDAFLNYLEDRKIDADLCHFILTFAQHKEQKE